jgi:hypothetical protein
MLKQLALLSVVLMLAMPVFGDSTSKKTAEAAPTNPTHGKPDKKSQKTTSAPAAGVNQNGLVNTQNLGKVSDTVGANTKKSGTVNLYNPTQSQTNQNGVGNLQNPAKGGDTVPTGTQNGPSNYNPTQNLGNLQSPDQDGDTAGANTNPNAAPKIYNPNQSNINANGNSK